MLPVPDLHHLQLATERIVRRFAPLRILVFGSYARGEAQSGSDLDLLVVLPVVKNKRQAAIEIRRALADLPVPHDVVVTTPGELYARAHLTGNVLHEALREGLIVYEQEEAP